MDSKIIDIEEDFCLVSELFEVLYDGLQYRFSEYDMPSGYIKLIELIKEEIKKVRNNF